MAEASSKPGPAVKRKRRPVEVVVCPDIPAPSSAAAAARRVSTMRVCDGAAMSMQSMQ